MRMESDIDVGKKDGDDKYLEKAKTRYPTEPFTRADLEPLLDVSSSTALRYINQWKDSGTLKVLGAGKSTKYTFDTKLTSAGDDQQIVSQIGAIPIRSDGKNHYIKSEDADRLAALVQQLQGAQIRNLPKGITIRRGGPEWYFAKNDAAFSSEGQGNAPAADASTAAPNAAFVELHGFEGIRSINGIKLPTSKTTPGNKHFYDISEDDARKCLAEGISIEEWRKASEYVHRDHLMFAGHVGISVDGGKTIYGYTPIQPDDKSDEDFKRDLYANKSFAGRVRNDTYIFNMANEAAGTLNTNTKVHVAPIMIDSKRSIDLQEQLQGMHKQKDGEHRKKYAFPYKIEDPRSENGAKPFEDANTANCGAFPGLVDVPVPLKSGQIRDYIPILQEWVKQAPHLPPDIDQ